MFDVGFSELLVIGIVALVVIGPEKLPRVARTVGALLGRMQRYVNDVKADINREIELDELKNLKTTVQDAARSIETSVNESVSGFQAQADELNKIASGETPPAVAEAAPLPSSDAAAVTAEAAPAEVTVGGAATTAFTEAAAPLQASLPLESAPTNASGVAEFPPPGPKPTVTA
jgi:sec-independent protein translocase protein TatB